ncbi:MAG TPA: DUF4388 domain-containing protein [Ktedonobacteraceae bacterium]|nr:DUF4388 domain-containing protein [Ktedonobacteraceae bacterium]
MSFISTLEQLHLPEVLQRIEVHSKTGLLIVKQDTVWVEFYFRNGRLMCIGPVRADAPLEKRLLQAGVISPQALHEALRAIGMAQPGETRLVITLMDLGYTNREDLRAWATREAVDVLSVLLHWRSGDIRFDDDIQPQNDPLLVALSPAALLAACPLPPAPEPSSARIAEVSPRLQEAQLQSLPIFSAPVSASALISPAMSGYVSASPFLADVQPMPESPLPTADVMFEGSQFTSPTTSLPAEPTWVATPFTLPCIDTSFMRPEMVLIPADISHVREQNPQFQLTPEQWRLLTRVDGQTSLQMIHQALAWPADFVCRVAGELIVQGLLRIITPVAQTPFELSPVSRDMIASGFGNGYVSPGAAAATAQPWAAISPTTDALPPSFTVPVPGVPFETVSQWGNGGNGATFVPGRGWVTGPQSFQPPQPSGPLTLTNGAYSNAGSSRR